MGGYAVDDLVALPALMVALLIPVLLWIAWSDLARMKIPNMAVLGVLAIFVLVGPLVLSIGDWGWRLLHFPPVLLLVFLLSQAGVMGAGDAKALAALAPYVALVDALAVLLILAVCMVGGLILHRVARRIGPLRRATPTWESWRDAAFPMGLSISAAMLIYVLVPFAV